MDLTGLFKASVKTLKATKKSLGLDTKSTLFKTCNRDPLLVKPREVVKQISKLNEILTENKMAYLNVINYLSSTKTMTEMDREEIDNAAQTIITACTNLIKEYKTEVVTVNRKSKQHCEHYENVIVSVENYLRHISKVYTEAKAIRVKRVIETHKLSKLETQIVSSSSKRETSPVEDFTPTTKGNTSSSVNIDDELSVEEMQMFESENNLLYNEMNSISDEVRQMENKVVHIAELQELFTEKVLQQEKDIERIATTVATATDDVKDANVQIRQAIQRNAGLRVWLLFFFIVMSFSLLFLDWYND